MRTDLAEIGEDEEFVLLIMEQEDKTFMKSSMSLLEELRNCEENGYLLWFSICWDSLFKKLLGREVYLNPVIPR